MDSRTEKILAQLRTGQTYAEVGKNFSVSRQRIEQIAKKYGLKEELRNLKAAERSNWAALERLERVSFLEKKARIQEAVQAVGDGIHPAYAAIKHRVRYQTLINAMSNAGVRSNAPRDRRKYSPFQIAAVRQMIYETDMDNDEIAWSTQVSYLRVKTERKRCKHCP